MRFQRLFSFRSLVPDWAIEILSPEQKPNWVIGNVLHCFQYGSQLSWFIDSDDLSVPVFLPNQQLELVYRDYPLPVLQTIELEL